MHEKKLVHASMCCCEDLYYVESANNAPGSTISTLLFQLHGFSTPCYYISQYRYDGAARTYIQRSDAAAEDYEHILRYYIPAIH